jgi:hypothetical protein
VADRIAVLAGGRIVYHGEPEEALAGLARWYRIDQGLIEPMRPRGRVPAAREPSEPTHHARPAEPAARAESHDRQKRSDDEPEPVRTSGERVRPRAPRPLLAPTILTIAVFAALLVLLLLALAPL